MRAEDFKLEQFSEADVMSQFLEQPVGFFNKIVNFVRKLLPVKVGFYVPTILKIKAELICEMVSVHIDKEFKVADLIHLLVEEFLDDYLLHGNALNIWDKFRQINNSFIVNRFRSDERTKFTKIEVSFSKNDLLELEMICNDVEAVRKKDHYFYLTVERLLELMFYNFMGDLLVGTQDNLVQNIIKMLNDE